MADDERGEPGQRRPLRGLRVYHSGVVSAWRRRDRCLRDLGLESRLVSSRQWDEGGAVVVLEPAPDEAWVIGASTWGRHPYRFAYDPRPLWRALRAERLDVLDLHEEPASLAVAEVLLLSALARRGRPAVSLYSAQNIAKRYPPPFRWFERLALRRAAAVHTCNEAAGEVLRGKGFAGTVTNLGLGVDVERFRPVADALGGDPSAAAEAIVVGYVGRLEPHKGVDVLVAAVARVEGVRLVVVGEGPEHAALLALARGLGVADRVAIRGHADHDDLPVLYRGFDIVAVPSLETPGWIEQFGRVAVEAMASGCAVVASASGSLPEVLDDAGVLVAPGDVTALAAAITALRDDPGERRRLGAAGAVRAAHFSWPAVAGRHAALYESMVP